MLDPRLAHQSRARALSPAEAALAAAMEQIFAAGAPDFAAVAVALQARGLARPSGSTAPWTADDLVAELVGINASLDAAYAQAGIGA